MNICVNLDIYASEYLYLELSEYIYVCWFQRAILIYLSKFKLAYSLAQEYHF